MGEHRRRDGRDVLDWLELLGRALGYWVEREWRVGGSAGSAQVDLVWHRRPQMCDPLFAFELETDRLDRLVANAAKVLSGPSSERAKPLYLFHLVLHGGHTAARPQVAANTFPQANYRIFLLDDEADRNSFVADVLAQHARVAEFVTTHAVADALVSSPVALDIDARLTQLQSSGLTAPFASDFADLTYGSRMFASQLVRALRPELHGHRPACDYPTWFGTSLAPPLHLGLIASLEPSLGARCLQALQLWQSEDSVRPTIAPAVGLSRDYDDLVFAYAPFLWALVAALMRHVSGATAFVCRQLRRVLDGGPTAALDVTGLTALWLLHVSAASDLEQEYEAARSYVNARGGMPQALQARPPWVAGTSDTMQEWRDDLADGPLPVPRTEDLRRMVIDHEDCRGSDPVDVALELLLWDGPVDGSGALVGWLHR